MLKTLLKNGLTIVGMVVLLAAYAIGSLSLVEFLNTMTIVVFLTAVVLLLEDVLRKALSARADITWQYAVMALFVIACDFLWLYLAICETWPQFFGRLVILAVACGGTVLWAFFAYRISLMSDEERKAFRLTKLYKKAMKNFPDMTDDEVAEALEATLFCRIEDDSLEGRLLSSEPFTPDYATYQELANRDDGVDYTSHIDAIGDYIVELVKKRGEK